jgi:hypothetical protein
MDSERIRPALAPTGDSRVDAAIQALASLGDMDLTERPAVLEAVHDQLREILGELGRPGEPGRPGEQGELGAGGTPRPGQPGPAQPRPGQPVGGTGAARPGVPGPGSWSRRPNS